MKSGMPFWGRTAKGIDMDIVTFETAKALKSAGFPQPPIFHHDCDFDGFFYILEDHEDLFGLTQYTVPVLYHAPFKMPKQGRNTPSDVIIFAPITTDILRRLPGHKIFYSATSWSWICQHTVSGKSHGNVNPAEACAAAWLELNNK